MGNPFLRVATADILDLVSNTTPHGGQTLTTQEAVTMVALRVFLAAILLKACIADDAAPGTDQTCITASDATRTDAILQKRRSLAHIHMQESDVGFKPKKD